MRRGRREEELVFGLAREGIRSIVQGAKLACRSSSIGAMRVWMTGDDDPVALLRTPAKDVLQEWIVSPRVDRSDFGDDDATLVEPVAVYQVEKRLEGARRQVVPLADFFEDSRPTVQRDTVMGR